MWVERDRYHRAAIDPIFAMSDTTLLTSHYSNQSYLKFDPTVHGFNASALNGLKSGAHLHFKFIGRLLLLRF